MDRGWACDLVPKALIVARYFAKEQAGIDETATVLESMSASLIELEEEQGGEEGVFADFEKINAASVKARIKEIASDPAPESKAEREVLNQWLKLSVQEGELKKALRDSEAALDTLALEKYPRLSEPEVKALVVDDKWLAVLDGAVHGEMDRISQALTRRVRDLAERYEASMPALAARVAEQEARVAAHLAKMGFK